MTVASELTCFSDTEEDARLLHEILEGSGFSSERVCEILSYKPGPQPKPLDPKMEEHFVVLCIAKVASLEPVSFKELSDVFEHWGIAA
ncbi:MAG: hypothetical protein GY861_20710 [bacterium]|nr:hypothetical protein [bacterium]